MTCSDCQTNGRWGSSATTRRDTPVERLRTLVCTSCGRLLPDPDSTQATDRLLATLASLSRFGLAPEGRPVLALGHALRGGV
ncbi:MAG TPA: hypothetical protein VFD85_00450 [Gemmatimonadales bacterium]|nr:hypothetical protein [Gemmatimonadales bacterium]